jgi:hypothetical protein
MTTLLPIMLALSAALAAEVPATELTFEPTTVTAIAPDLAAMVLPYAEEDPAALEASRMEAAALLDRYQAHARVAMVGEILTTRTAGPDGAEYTIVTLAVRDAYRGRRVSRIAEFRVDRPVGTAAPGELRPELVEGYQVLVFVDRNGWLMDGDALFTVEAEHAFRKRRDRVFSRPSADRDWQALTDPAESWTTLSLDSVQAAMAVRPSRRSS